jgi:hypothetical protein
MGPMAGRRIRPLWAAAALTAFLLAARPVPACAQQTEALSVWTYSLYKTITYELFANLVDIPLYGWLIGGGAAATGFFTVVNVTTAAGAYYVHEVIWNLYGPATQEAPETAMTVGIEKLIVYRVVSTARNLALFYAFGAGAPATVTFLVVSNIVDATLYGANEYAWYALGPPVQAIVPEPSAEPRRAARESHVHPISSAVMDATAGLRVGASYLATAIDAAWLSRR